MILRKELFPANYFCPQCRIYAQESLNLFQDSLKREESNRKLTHEQMAKRYRQFRRRLKETLRQGYRKKLQLELQAMQAAHEELINTIERQLLNYLKEAKEHQVLSLIEGSENICSKIQNLLPQITAHQVLTLRIHPDDYLSVQNILPQWMAETVISDVTTQRGNFILELSGQGEITYDWKQEFHKWL